MFRDPEITLFVSAVSLWEIWLKQSLGKLELPADFAEKLAAESFENLPLLASQTRQVAFGTSMAPPRSLRSDAGRASPSRENDPADR